MKITHPTFFAVFALSSSLFGDVISDTNITLHLDDWTPDYTHRIEIYQDAPATDVTYVWFNANSFTLTLKDQALDGPKEMFLLSYGEEFSEASIANSEVQSWAYDEDIVRAGSFYIGVRADNSSYDGKIYGWMNLFNDGSSISMSGNAVTYGTEGIITGTNQTVPEPSTILLFGIGGLGTLFLRKNKVPMHKK